MLFKNGKLSIPKILCTEYASLPHIYDDGETALQTDNTIASIVSIL
jgi:hypothetical protein